MKAALLCSYVCIRVHACSYWWYIYDKVDVSENVHNVFIILGCCTVIDAAFRVPLVWLLSLCFRVDSVSSSAIIYVIPLYHSCIYGHLIVATVLNSNVCNTFHRSYVLKITFTAWQSVKIKHCMKLLQIFYCHLTSVHS